MRVLTGDRTNRIHDHCHQQAAIFWLAAFNIGRSRGRAQHLRKAEEPPPSYRTAKVRRAHDFPEKYEGFPSLRSVTRRGGLSFVAALRHFRLMANGHHHQTDVVIVGAGPVGLFAVFECGMVRLALPRRRRARRCRRPVHRALSGEADLRHPGLSPHRRGRAGRAAEGAGGALQAGLSSGRAGPGARGAEPAASGSSPPRRARCIAGARGDHRRRRRRLRAQPAAARRASRPTRARASSTTSRGARNSAASAW